MEIEVVEKLKSLILQKLTGQLSSAQQQELDELFKQPGVKEFVNRFDEDYILQELKIFNNIEQGKAAAWDRMSTRLPEKRKVLPLWKRLAIAASFTLVVSAGVYIYINAGKEPTAVTQKEASPVQDILPPSGNAVLTLANGRQITLDEKGKTAVLANEEGAIVKATGDKGLVYEAATGATSTVYNMVSTPKGVMYSITLADGTRCWLNTSSSLRYPTAFIGKERRVSVTGEVYFDVAKDKARPFIVTADNSEIKVLGTQFNVNAYSNEAVVSTTLIEGKVQVEASGKQELLSPGQQARASRTDAGLQLMKNVNLTEVLGWRENKFVFQGEGMDIRSIMKQLQRYYDIEVEYQGNLPDDDFKAIMPRDLPISRILGLFQKTERLRFSIDGRKVVVMPWK